MIEQGLGRIVKRQILLGATNNRKSWRVVIAYKDKST